MQCQRFVQSHYNKIEFFRGISLSVFILLVLTLIAVCIVFALTSYLFNCMNVLQQHFIVQPYIYVCPETTLEPHHVKLFLYIINEGPSTTKIIKVEIESGNGMYVYVPSLPIVIPPNAELNISIPREGETWQLIGDPNPIVSGFRYRVKIFTERGVLIYDVVAREK